METDLHAVIRANNILEEVHKQYIIYQILKCLKYMHTAELLHRDLKPSNILLNSECLAKVCDLGLARSIAMKEEGTAPVLTEYVATRWYRAPEILLGSQKYTKGVDMWSLGCILGELLLGKPIFPGTSTLNQLDRILELTGRPSPEDIEAIQSSLAGTMLEALPQTKTKPLHEFFPTASDEALDLLKKLLCFNPNKRLTAEQALEHPYVSEFHNIDDEPSCERVIQIAIDDNTKFSIREYRDKLYQEIMKKKKEQRKVILENTFTPTLNPHFSHPNNQANISAHNGNIYQSKVIKQEKEEEKIQKVGNNQNFYPEQKNDKMSAYNNMTKKSSGVVNNSNAMQQNKHPSVKGKNSLTNNGSFNQSSHNTPAERVISKNTSNNDKNYNFVSNNVSSGSSNIMNKVIGHGSYKPNMYKEEKAENHYSTATGVKSVLNSGIVYRTNNSTGLTNKKTYGKI